ncbi:MAG: YkgJ family cysteine cluster protein [Promethearchaeota archaeon]
MPQPQFRFKCVRCGRCCTDKNTIVTLSYHDVLRIARFFDFTIDECKEVVGFYLLKGDITDERIRKMVLPPAMLEEGLAVIGLMKDENGACIYYDKGSGDCNIYGARPMVCRTFPFTFRYKKSVHKRVEFKIEMDLTEKGKTFCKGLGGSPPLVRRREWEKVGAETIRQFLHHQVFVEKWNEAVERGEVKPIVDNYLRTIFAFEGKVGKT